MRSASVGGGDRALDQRHVVGAVDRGPRHLGEVGDAHGPGQGQQLVLAVEQAQLAAVARGELPHGQGGPVRRPAVVAHRSRSVSRWATSRRRGGPGRRGTAGTARAGSGRTRPTPHCMLRSSDTRMRVGVDAPCRSRARAVKRIMISGPQTRAVAVGRVEAGLGQQRGDQARRGPSSPGPPRRRSPPRGAPARRQASRSSPKTIWSGLAGAHQRRTPARRRRGDGPPARRSAPRSGARPIPPATTTTSPPSRRPVRRTAPQSVPNGPRTPTRSPTRCAHRACGDRPDVTHRVARAARGRPARC